MPAVSVVMPFLDPSPAFLEAAIGSVLEQTLADWELVLVDDGSGRAAREVAARFAERDDRIRVVRSEEPRPAGISAARNAGIAASNADLVAMLDADDRYEPQRLERHVDILRSVPEAAMVIGDTVYWATWRDGPEPADDMVPAMALEPGLVEPPHLLVSFLEGRGASPCVCSITVRRSILDETGGFEPSFRSVYEDQVFLAKVCSTYPVFYLNETLDRYRIHAGSVTAGASQPGAPSSRRRFLDWLQTYVMRQAPPSARPPILQALCNARREMRHPLLAGLRRRIRKWLVRRTGAK